MHHISYNSRLDCMHVLLVLKTIVYSNFSIPSELFWLRSQRNSWYQAKGVQEFFLKKEGREGGSGEECGAQSKKGSSLSAQQPLLMFPKVSRVLPPKLSRFPSLQFRNKFPCGLWCPSLASQGQLLHGQRTAAAGDALTDSQGPCKSGEIRYHSFDRCLTLISGAQEGGEGGGERRRRKAESLFKDY